jgi:plastocyanin
MKVIVCARIALLVGVALVVAVGLVFKRQGHLIALAQGHMKAYVMDQKKTAFMPQQLSIPRGATVTFQNDDVTEHNVTLAIPQDDGILDEDIGTFPPGQKVSYTFKHPGTVRVHCKIHPEMKAIIMVR